MKRLLRVLNGEPLSPPPVWLMRQAGRYLPEYRATREKAGSFLDLCYTPELAEEVTLQPIRRYGFDAAILFADILLVPQALGMNLTFVEGEGPRMRWPKEPVDLGSLRPVDEIDETLSPVYKTVGRLSRSLPEETTLIGFAGAPWTVATYMIAGRGSTDQAATRKALFAMPDTFAALIDRVTEATIHYLSRQIDAGAEVVMLFDSWAGALPASRFDAIAVKPAQRIAGALRERHPGIRFIGFPRGVGALYPSFAEAVKPDAVALDSQMPLGWARTAMPNVALQGNLDPALMIVGGEALKAETQRILAEMDGHPHIFNLGHGITPEADPGNVDLLLKTIRG
ncbi:MAG: uroporphyrinogen decarboxylase [Pseudomonadota bacterium]